MTNSSPMLIRTVAVRSNAVEMANSRVLRKLLCWVEWSPDAV